MSLALHHARYATLETLRVPIAVVSTAMFPALSLLFFVVPFSDVASDPVAATAAAAQLSVFAVFSVCLFSFGVSVAEERAQPWEPFVRTLPVGSVPRVVARLLTGVALALIGILPLVAVAVLLTSARASLSEIILGLAALAVAGVPLLLMGVALGYSLPVKAALPVAQLLLFPLAFAGGLFFPPQVFPAWLDTLSQGLPTRAGRDLVVAAVSPDPVPVAAPAVLAVWVLVAGAVAVWAYRRDEGRRFR